MTQQTNPPAFRVWCNDRKQWIKRFVIDEKGEVFIKMSSDFKGDNLNSFEVLILPNPTICKFTGLFDVKGKPIYENDIYMLENGEYRIVCFIEHSHTSYHGSMVLGTIHTAGFYGRDYYPLYDKRKDVFYGFVGNIEILGNVLENPNMEGLE